MACFVKYKDNSTKGILNLLVLRHILFINTIEKGIAVVNSTANN